MRGWVIKRLEDGQFYVGTADRDPYFTTSREDAARFGRAQDAERRAQGLAGSKDYEGEFEIEASE